MKRELRPESNGNGAQAVSRPQQQQQQQRGVAGDASSKRPRTGELAPQRIVAFPYVPGRAEGGVRGDPFMHELLLRKAQADMRYWTAEVLEETGKREAMARLNRQLMEYNELADFGMARAGWNGVARRLIPFDMDLDARVVLLFTGPTLDEQKNGGGYEGMVWDRTAREETWQAYYNAKLLNEFRQGVALCTKGVDLSGVRFDRAFVVPMRKFGADRVDDERIGNGAVLFARYLLVALCIVRPRIVVCMGREPARAMLVDLDNGGPTADAPKERYNQVLVRKVAEAGSRTGVDHVLGTLTYVETIHPFVATKSDEEVTIVGQDSEGRDVEDHLHRGQIDAALAAKRAVLETTHGIVGAKIHGQPNTRVNPFAVMMRLDKRIQFDTPGAKLAGKAPRRKAAASTFAYTGQQDDTDGTGGA
jgi:hypothetical protein